MNIPIRLIAIGMGALAAIGLVLWLTGALTSGKVAKVEAELQGNRAGAAVESGQDAANTVGDRARSEDELDGKVDDANDAIRKAPDAGAGDDAARRGLCDISPDYC